MQPVRTILTCPFCDSRWFEQVCHEQILYLQKRSASEDHIRTVFDISLRPNREKEQFTPTVDEMTADAFALFNAGTTTTSYAMVVTTWALLNKPQMMQRLKAELKVAMPGRNDIVDWAGLERLPYLVSKWFANKLLSPLNSRLTKRSAQLSRRDSASPSAFRDASSALRPIQAPSYADTRYQPGYISCTSLSYTRVLTSVYLQTLVSSSSYVYHLDPHAFHDPEAFRPERWLADSPSDLKEQERKFLPFSRGSRMCIGINLAYAELHLTLAHLFRRFELSNHGTSEADMQWDDYITPVTRGHLKVTLKHCAD